MRAAQLIRSRTRKGCTASIDLYQAPVIIYAQSGDVDDNTVIPPLSLAIHVSTGHEPEKRIGGITLVRQVLLRRRIRVPRTKQKWTDWEEIQRQEVEVVSECVVQGSHRFECTLLLPKRLPESRQTHYDQLIHMVTATVHDLSPSYPSHRSHFSRPPGRSRSSSTASISSLNRKPPSSPSELRTVPEEQDYRIRPEELEEVKHKAADVIAVSKKLFEVAYCPTPHAEVPVLDAVQTVRLENSGSVRAKLQSDLFVMGSSIDLSLDLLDLTLDTTIHALSVQLVQDTATPAKADLPDDLANPAPATPANSTPAAPRSSFFRRGQSRDQSRDDESRPPPLSRLTNMFSRVKEKPAAPQTSIIDEYILHREGIDHYITARELGVREGHYLWRGAAGREYDRRCAAEAARQNDDDEYIDEYKLDHQAPTRHADTMTRTTSSLRIQRVLRLPSELHGVHATSSTLAPVLSKVSHRIVVTVLYSILGFDKSGQRLPEDEAAGHGGVRQATLIFEIGLAQCTVVPCVIRPPIYTSPSDTDAVVLDTSVQRSPRRSLRRLSTDTIRSLSVTRAHMAASQPTTIAEERAMSSAPAGPVQHTQAFKASNGLVVSGNKVFYDEAEYLENWLRHHRERLSCACTTPAQAPGLCI